MATDPASQLFLTHYQTVSGKESEINQYVAEVRFFKAMQYAGLMRTFGDIPGWIKIWVQATRIFFTVRN